MYPLKSSTVQKIYEFSPVDTSGRKFLVTYSTWREYITNTRGNPDDIAINIYGWVVGWYKPASQNRGGTNAAPMQRFGGEFFRTSYKEINTELGYSQTQSRRALVRLEELKLLRRVETKTQKGTRVQIDLFYDALVRISRAKPRGEFFEAALDEGWEPLEIRHWDRSVTEKLADELITTICGGHFVQAQSWLAEIEEIHLEKVILICTKMHRLPEDFEHIKSKPAFIKSSIRESFERLSGNDIGWIREQLERIQSDLQ